MQSFKEWAAANKGVLIGAGIGLILAVMMLVFGFFPTLLIAFFVGVGAALGGIEAIAAIHLQRPFQHMVIERFFKN